MVRECEIEHIDVAIGQADRRQHDVEHGCVADAGRIAGDLQALQVGQRLELAGLDEVLAHDQLGRTIARRRLRLVGNDAHLDLAGDRIIHASRW